MINSVRTESGHELVSRSDVRSGAYFCETCKEWFPTPDDHADAEMWREVVEKSSWFLEGEFGTVYADALSRTLATLRASDVPVDGDAAMVHWLMLAELDRLGMLDFDTSPRDAFLTARGERFAAMFDARRASGPIDWSVR